MQPLLYFAACISKPKFSEFASLGARNGVCRAGVSDDRIASQDQCTLLLYLSEPR
jgi:hypothetical protein